MSVWGPVAGDNDAEAIMSQGEQAVMWKASWGD